MATNSHTFHRIIWLYLLKEYEHPTINVFTSPSLIVFVYVNFVVTTKHPFVTSFVFLTCSIATVLFLALSLLSKWQVFDLLATLSMVATISGTTYGCMRMLQAQTPAYMRDLLKYERLMILVCYVFAGVNFVALIVDRISAAYCEYYSDSKNDKSNGFKTVI